MKQQFQALHKELRLGEIAYQFYYKPTARLRFYQSRGTWNVLSAQIGERALKKKLESFPAPQYDAVDVDISFLTGEKYWHQTLLCALSLVHNIKQIPSFTIYSDGTLNAERIQLLKRFFPDLIIVDKKTAEDKVNDRFPRSNYPALRQARDHFILMKKLLDIPLISPHAMYLDSDMIFWGYPAELLELYQAQSPFYMKEQDIPDSYGLICDTPIIEEKTGIKPIPHFNSGMFHIGNADIDWPLIESWCSKLLSIPEQHSPSMLEQTLFCLIFTCIQNAQDLSDSYYVAFDKLPTKSVLTHYVNSMKFKYMNTEQYRWFHEFKAA